MKINWLIIVLWLGLVSCQQDYLPKPKGYNRIVLPDTLYQSLADTFPYDFQYSQHARILKDSSWITERYWIDIYYPYFDAFVQVTYKPVQGQSNLEEYINDSYRLTSKHNVKADAIDDKVLYLKSGNVAMISELSGEVPSQFQFYITDSMQHFLRGALYFKTSTKNDSLAPAVDFIKNDIVHLLNTVEWRN
jgi:gliding motility-associated lipoprotein GldD